MESDIRENQKIVSFGGLGFSTMSQKLWWRPSKQTNFHV